MAFSDLVPEFVDAEEVWPVRHVEELRDVHLLAAALDGVAPVDAGVVTEGDDGPGHAHAGPELEEEADQVLAVHRPLLDDAVVHQAEHLADGGADDDALCLVLLLAQLQSALAVLH